MIALKCNVSLSKKLRALLGRSGHVTLTVDRIIDGSGEGTIILGGDEEQYDPQALGALLGKETSIMLTATSQEQAVDLRRTTSNLFTDTEPSQIAANMATITPPDRGQMKVKYQDVDVPDLRPLKAQQDQPLLQTPKKKRVEAASESIMNLNDLTKALKSALEKNDIKPPDVSGMNERQRAVAIEEWESLTGIDEHCYIVNDSCLQLVVNDLEKTLSYNIPVDLSKISARKLLLSKELREVINEGLVKFVRPEDIGKYQAIVKETEEQAYQTSDVFDSHEEAMGAVAAEGFRPDGTKISVTAERMNMDSMDDLEADTEEEAMMRQLSGQIGTPMPEGGTELSGSAGSARKTQHSNKHVDPFAEFDSPIKKMGQSEGGIVRRRDG